MTTENNAYNDILDDIEKYMNEIPLLYHYADGVEIDEDNRVLHIPVVYAKRLVEKVSNDIIGDKLCNIFPYGDFSTIIIKYRISSIEVMTGMLHVETEWDYADIV